MGNKKFIWTITSVVGLFCLFYLSFTFISRHVQNKAAVFASNEKGEVDLGKKQAFLDSVWDEPVFSLLGMEFTYQEVKEKEMKLGLDLQGGMHVVLEVSSADLLIALSGDNQSPAFRDALRTAEARSKSQETGFLQAFSETYQENSKGGRLADLFATISNKEEISMDSADEEVLRFLDKEINAATDRSLEILRSRIDKFGVSSPNIQKLPNTNRIQLELAGVENPERVRKLLQGLAQLEFWEVYEQPALENYFMAVNNQWLQKQESVTVKESAAEADTSLAGQLAAGQQSADSLQVCPLFSHLKSGYGLVYSLSDTAEINHFLSDPAVAKVKPANLELLWEAKPFVTESGEELLELYALKKSKHDGAALSGDVILDARQELEEGKPTVSMQMNSQGAMAWKNLTSKSIGRQIAIVMDDQVYSAPVVQSEIPNGFSSISGSFTIDEAQDLANLLKAGKMPAPVKIVEEAVVGPTLGMEAVSQGVLSMLAGLGLVALFMTSYYGKSGWVANLVLLVNILFVFGILAQLGTALTLPGIAGIVLTIGMSVDANVLIFERIREELKLGSSLRMAIKTGYDKAYSSIIDSNVTTFLTGFILFSFGSGGVKGFAVVLMIGILCSVFTAVFLSRLILEILLKKEKLSEQSFDTFLSGKIGSRASIDFVKYRKVAYTFSALFIGIGLLAAVLQGGYHMGVDFKGGRSYIIQFNEPVGTLDLRQALTTHLPDGSLEIKTYNDEHKLKVTTSYLVDEDSPEADRKVEEAINAGLKGFDGSEPQIVGSAKVGATMADDVKTASQKAIFYSLVAIFLYILVRFNKWQFGLGAVVALFHDVLMIFAAYGLAGLLGWQLEIDQVFIAAVLTVIGYSINDTVVIFDRIREFAGKSQTREEMKAVINPAVNETLGRTIITSLTVFLVVVILLIFGGEVLRGFSFSLLIGVIFGTYSSVFIASPVVLDFYTQRAGKQIKQEQEKKLAAV